MEILDRAVKDAKKQPEQTAAILYNAMVVMYECVCYSPITRGTIAGDGVAAITVISACLADHTCHELGVCVMYQFYNDPKTREIFANKELAAMVVKVRAVWSHPRMTHANHHERTHSSCYHISTLT